jgi:hypothetical protein
MAWLSHAIDRFRKARDEVRAVWGEYVAAPLQSAGDTCSILLTGIVMDMRDAVPKVISDRDFADTCEGARRREEILD